jgi:hypothetical protein
MVRFYFEEKRMLIDQPEVLRLVVSVALACGVTDSKALAAIMKATGGAAHPNTVKDMINRISSQSGLPTEYRAAHLTGMVEIDDRDDRKLTWEANVLLGRVLVTGLDLSKSK